jgi:hypothetical protein
MKRVQRVMFAVSLTAIWCLLMPPYLYGVIGIFAAFLCGHAAGKHLPEYRSVVKNQFKLWHIILLVFVFYMFIEEFVIQWKLSSKMAVFSNLLGITVEQFLIIVAIVGSVISLYAAIYIICGVRRQLLQNKVKSYPQESTDRKLDGKDVIFAIAVALLLGMRLALNPWSGELPGNDSAAYLYVGMMLRKSVTLYTELFEHKGLILYLIDALGMSITDGSLTGVWILEMLNAFAATLLILKVTKLFTDRKTVQYITGVGLISSMTICMLLTDGNLSEEWVLPWITLSVYIFLKYFLDKKYRFYEIILLGVSFAIIVFIRANMIAVFAAFMPLVLIYMIMEKQWKDIGICVANFLIGILIVAAPILIYTLRVGSLQAMIQDYFLFSFSYIEEGGMPITYVMWRLFRRLTVYSAILLIGIRMFYKNHIFQMNSWYYAISIVVASISGRAHAHYAIILIPALIVPMVMVLNQIPEMKINKLEDKITAVIFLFAAAQFSVSFFGYQKPELSEVAQYLQDTTTEDENVVMMGNNCVYYLESGRYTTNKYYYHAPIANVSEPIYEDIVKELEQKKTDVLVVIGQKQEILNGDNNLSKIYQMLDEWSKEGTYRCEEYDSFYVYRLQ